MNRKYRKTVIAGNWKMNKTPAEAKELVAALVEKYPADEAEVRADVAYFLGKLKEANALV